MTLTDYSDYETFIKAECSHIEKGKKCRKECICESCFITYINFHIKFIELPIIDDKKCICQSRRNIDGYYIANMFDELCSKYTNSRVYNFYGGNYNLTTQECYHDLFRCFISTLNKDDPKGSKLKLYNYYKPKLFGHLIPGSVNYINNFINGWDYLISNVLYEIPFVDLIEFIVCCIKDTKHDSQLLIVVNARLVRENFMNFDELVNNIKNYKTVGVDKQLDECRRTVLINILENKKKEQEYYKKSLQISHQIIGEDFLRNYFRDFKNNINEAKAVLTEEFNKKLNAIAREVECEVTDE